MNREIKFRAWDGYNKVFKFYTLKQLAGDDQFSYDTEVEAIQSGFDNWVWMQYTGLKDKNGKEIYEGDILALEDTESHFVDVGIGEVKVAETIVNTLGLVKYLPGGFVIEINNGGENWHKGITPFLNSNWTHPHTFDVSDMQKEVEVIGNIFENADYLKYH